MSIRKSKDMEKYTLDYIYGAIYYFEIDELQYCQHDKKDTTFNATKKIRGLLQKFMIKMKKKKKFK